MEAKPRGQTNEASAHLVSAVVKSDRQAGWVPPVIPFIQCGTLVCEMILLTFKEDLLAKVEQLWKYPRLMSVPKQRDSGKAFNNPHFFFS